MLYFLALRILLKQMHDMPQVEGGKTPAKGSQ